MSFLYDRIVAHIDKATTDPNIEKELQAKRDKLKELIKTNQSLIDSQRKFLFDKTPKKITDPVLIAYEDIQLLKAIIDELDNLNKSASDIGTLNDKTEEIINRYNSLARNAFKSGTSWSDKIDIKGRGTRLTYYSYINALRQALNDFPDMPSEYKGPAKDILAILREILKNNLYTNDKSYEEGLYNLQEKYSKLKEKILQGREKGKDIWDPKDGIMAKIANESIAKVLSKNIQRIDFKELPTDPEVLSDIVKSKEESDAIKADKEQDTFSIWNVIKNAVSRGITIGGILLIVLLALMGASIAVNLNVYKPIGFRILYLIYGMIFSPVVIFYGILYRSWWHGKKPVYYSFLPLIPYFFVNRYTQFLLGWLTYRPDNEMWNLEEWHKH